MSKTVMPFNINYALYSWDPSTGLHQVLNSPNVTDCQMVWFLHGIDGLFGVWIQPFENQTKGYYTLTCVFSCFSVFFFSTMHEKKN